MGNAEPARKALTALRMAERDRKLEMNLMKLPRPGQKHLNKGG